MHENGKITQTASYEPWKSCSLYSIISTQQREKTVGSASHKKDNTKMCHGQNSSILRVYEYNLTFSGLVSPK